MSPAEAIAAGASYLVVGRPIIAAPDPRLAAAAIVDEMRGALRLAVEPGQRRPAANLPATATSR